MKLRGRKLEERSAQELVFERPSGPIVFTLSAVMNTSDFDKIYPEPKPPMIIIKGGSKVANDRDKTYLASLSARNIGYMDWLVINTMAGTPELEWEQVKEGDPNTWNLWRKELSEAGMTDGEIAYIIKKTVEVNGLSEERLEEARKSFLQQRQREMSLASESLDGVQLTT
jgi:hypothetical protein